MKLEHVELRSYRNIASASVEFSPGSTVLLGENAQGKTNLMEAVYLMACGKSFRTPRFRDLIRHGEKRGQIKISVTGEGLPFQLAMTLDSKEGKKIEKNSVPIHRLSDFLGLFRVVLFCPEHLSLIKDGPGKRRSFLDSAICQLRPYFASLLNECNKIEAQRAALLKQHHKRPVPRELFEVWEDRLAAVSVKIACIRADYIKLLSQMAPEHFSRISSGRETLSLSYASDVYLPDTENDELVERYKKILSEGFESDLKYGFTSKGIHRDDLNVLVDSYPARGFASQGQQRSTVLALKLAEGEISRNMTGRDPVYLLDDVLSELDEGRRSYVTGGLLGKQVILSGTDAEAFSFVDRMIHVKGGEFFR